GRLLPLRRRNPVAAAARARRTGLVLQRPRTPASGVRLRAVRLHARLGLLAVSRQLDETGVSPRRVGRAAAAAVPRARRRAPARSLVPLPVMPPRFWVASTKAERPHASAAKA